jgi:hypothetical protein
MQPIHTRVKPSSVVRVVAQLPGYRKAASLRAAVFAKVAADLDDNSLYDGREATYENWRSRTINGWLGAYPGYS